MLLSACYWNIVQDISLAVKSDFQEINKLFEGLYDSNNIAEFLSESKSFYLIDYLQRIYSIQGSLLPIKQSSKLKVFHDIFDKY